MKPITVVCGFPRCGSSMLMRMLSAGGVPAFAQSEFSYEHEFATLLPDDHLWLAECGGMCVKILEPGHYTPPPLYPYRFLWMHRSPLQQALSTLKFLTTLHPGMIDSSRATIASYVRQFTHDAPVVQAMLGAYPNSKLLSLSFENVLRMSQGAALLVKEFLELPLDTQAMASVVRKRSPKCLPYLQELQDVMETMERK